MPADDLVIKTPQGLYCPPGGFHIDPMGRTETAVITHGHGDHARYGSQRYLAAHESLPILRLRLGPTASIGTAAYGRRFRMGDTWVSFHPAGHVLGSAQVRIEHGSRVWVVTGDYKRAPDPTCAPFEVVECDVFVTESTFALPVYRWQATEQVVGEISAWIDECQSEGQTAVLFCYALGKAQRLMAHLKPHLEQPILLHGAQVPLTEAYRGAGVDLPDTEALSALPRDTDLAGRLVIAPPSAAGSPWMRRFKTRSTGFCSGWMRIRGNRRRRGYDRGFVISDHADWPALLQSIRDSGARRVICMHGRTDALVRYLNERGTQRAESLGMEREEED